MLKHILPVLLCLLLLCACAPAAPVITATTRMMSSQNVANPASK